MKVAGLWLAFVSLSAASLLGNPPSGDGEATLPVVPAAVDWTVGPAKVKIGSVAELTVPPGYKFADAETARIHMREMKNPVSQHLAGMLSPVSGGWFVILENVDFGYVPNAAQSQLDPAALLATLRSRSEQQNRGRAKQKLSTVTSVDWQVEPRFDADKNILEWAVKAQGAGEGVMNHTVRMLTRLGALDLTAVMPLRSFVDLAPLNQLAQGITISEGQRYADYKAGDKVSEGGLAEMVLAEVAAEPTPESETTLASVGAFLLWGCAIALGCFAITGIVVITRKYQAVRAVPVVAPQAAPVSAPAPALAPANGHSNGNGNGQANGSNGHFAPRKTHIRAHGTARPATQANGKDRKRTFDYNRYFADLMATVSTHSSVEKTSGTNGDLFRGWSAAANGNGALPGSAEAHSQLIATQMSIIDEQKRIIEAQSRLIEEKSRLIAEKNDVLRMQADLLEPKLL